MPNIPSPAATTRPCCLTRRRRWPGRSAPDPGRVCREPPLPDLLGPRPAPADAAAQLLRVSGFARSPPRARDVARECPADEGVSVPVPHAVLGFQPTHDLHVLRHARTGNALLPRRNGTPVLGLNRRKTESGPRPRSAPFHSDWIAACACCARATASGRLRRSWARKSLAGWRRRPSARRPLSNARRPRAWRRLPRALPRGPPTRVDAFPAGRR